jgi:hypothetical protein
LVNALKEKLDRRELVERFVATFQPAHLPRVPVFNRVPPELRICAQCGAMMTTVSHSSCFILNVIPARVFVEERLDETIACPNDGTIVSASPPPQVVERGR